MDTDISEKEIGHLSQHLRPMIYGTNVEVIIQMTFILKLVVSHLPVAEWHHLTSTRIECQELYESEIGKLDPSRSSAEIQPRLLVGNHDEDLALLREDPVMLVRLSEEIDLLRDSD